MSTDTSDQYSDAQMDGNVSQYNATVGTYFLSNEWVAYHATAVLLWILSGYFMISQIMYDIRRSRRGNQIGAIHSSNDSSSGTPTSNKQLDPGTNSSGQPGAKRTSKNRASKWGTRDVLTRVFQLVAAISAFLYSNIAIVELHFGWKSGTVCLVTYQCTILFYTVAIAAVYITLWDRQRRLYMTKALRHLTTGTLRRISAAMLTITLFSAIAAVVILNLSASAESTARGCFRTKRNIPRWVRVAILPVLGVIQQGLLLGLVIHPLKKHVSGTKPTSPPKRNESGIRALINRLAVCSGTCVASDIALIVVLSLLSGEHSSGIIGQLATTFNLLVNITSLFLSFATWRERLYVCSTCNK